MNVKPDEKIKFSSFMEKEKVYDYSPNFKIDRKDFPEYKQKEEFSKIKFDENIRHRLPELENHIF